jgi:separase
VANLWDVTDRDIDRFLLELLKQFTDIGAPLVDSIMRSRSVCKLKSLIGAAPVVYGVPINL